MQSGSEITCSILCLTTGLEEGISHWNIPQEWHHSRHQGGTDSVYSNTVVFINSHFNTHTHTLFTSISPHTNTHTHTPSGHSLLPLCPPHWSALRHVGEKVLPPTLSLLHLHAHPCSALQRHVRPWSPLINRPFTIMAKSCRFFWLTVLSPEPMPLVSVLSISQKPNLAMSCHDLLSSNITLHVCWTQLGIFPAVSACVN